MEDKILIGTSENSRFIIASTSNMSKKALQKYDLPDFVLATELSLINIATLMSQSIKGANTKITIVVSADGVLGNAKACITGDGRIISSSSFDDRVTTMLNTSDEETFKSLYKIGKGIIKITIDFGMKRPYYTRLNIDEGNSLEDIVNSYLTSSEQVEGIIRQATCFDDNGNLQKSAAYMIQALPSGNISRIKEKLAMIHSLSTLITHNFEPSDILRLIFEDVSDGATSDKIEEYNILEERKLVYKCSCSEQYFKMLTIQSLDRSEIEKIIKEEGYIENVCGFCSSCYRWSEI